jgi:hypothetical protein
MVSEVSIHDDLVLFLPGLCVVRQNVMVRSMWESKVVYLMAERMSRKGRGQCTLPREYPPTSDLLLPTSPTSE